MINSTLVPPPPKNEKQKWLAMHLEKKLINFTSPKEIVIRDDRTKI